MKTCTVGSCERQVLAKGLCRTHYQRNAKYGDPSVTFLPQLVRGALPTRFWAKVNKHGPVPECRQDLGECWVWTAYVDPDGYGRIAVGERMALAHRVSWELANGSVPDGHELDHLCRRRSCIRPSHLEPVLQRENWIRGEATSAINAKKTHCLNGHALPPYQPGKGRRCRECVSIRNAQRRRAS